MDTRITFGVVVATIVWGASTALAAGFQVKEYSTNYSTRFNSLPLEGQVRNSNVPWGDSYWPKNHGGIGYRWREHLDESAKQEVTPEEAQAMFFSSQFPSKNDLLNMSRDQIANLSPAEKFDIINKNFDYPMAKAALGRKHTSVKMRNSPNDAYWEGYCNAWAAVSLHYAEPKPVVRTVRIKGSTIEIPFGSGDIKALMVASYAEDLDKNPQVGNFCHETFTFPATKMFKGREVFAQYPDTDGLFEADYPTYLKKYQEDVKRLGYNPVAEVNPNDSNLLVRMLSAMNTADCQDTNAGEFHLLMTNQIGLQKEGFVIDKTRDNEIWNQPAFKYVSTLVGTVPLPTRHARDAVSAVQMKTTLYYADDTDYGWTFWNPTLTNLFQQDGAFLDEFARYGRMLVNQGNEESVPKYPDGVIGKSHYIYNLELDSTGGIVGGEWVTFDRPDIAWMPKHFSFRGDYAGINGLYEPLSIPDNVVLNFGEP